MFTSKLPRFATSAKRPSGPGEGSTSFMSSNLPVSVRKANLFTPQPKRSLHGTLSSSKPYMTTEKKYQRVSKPAPDRDEQMRMFATLVEHLKERAPGLRMPDSKRFFSSVSTTETASIFEVLLSAFFTNFKINRLEVDVPEALAALGYPYIRSVTKSSLVSITTRQAVGNLLVIFNWLVVNAQDDLSIYKPKAPNDEIFLSMLRRDDASEDDDKRKNLKNRISGVKEEIRKIDEDVQRLYQQKYEINELSEGVEKCEIDIDECKTYYQQMQLYMEEKHNLLKEVRQRRAKLRHDLDDIEKRSDFLKSDPLVENGLNLLPGWKENLEQGLSSLKNQMDEKISQHNRLMAQATSQLDNETRGSKRAVELAEMEMTRLNQEINSEREKSKAEEGNSKESEKLLLELLKQNLEAYKHEAIALYKRAQIEQEFWKQAEQRVRENNHVVRAGMKLLVKSK